MSAERTSPARAAASRVWFAVFGAPLAWALQGLASWLLRSLACPHAPRDAASPAAAMDGTLLRSLEILVAAGALVAAVAALSVAISIWRHSCEAHPARAHGVGPHAARERTSVPAGGAAAVPRPSDAGRTGPPLRMRRERLAIAAMLVSLAFMIAIVRAAIGPLLLPLCAPAP